MPTNEVWLGLVLLVQSDYGLVLDFAREFALGLLFGPTRETPETPAGRLGRHVAIALWVLVLVALVALVVISL